jgi:VCBS repeat-containing protein
MSNKLIQALEPRLMLDGAAVATAIDAVDDLAQFQKSESDKSSKADHFKVDKDTKLPFVNLDTSAQNSKSRQIVFIDSTVEDIETLINSLDKNTEVHVIQSNQDGFVTMQNILSSQENIDAVHVIGHGSVGQIAFGTAVLNSDTLSAYENILQEIGSSLSENGDILFYGCNIAADQSGEILIKQIADITDADVAASDDVTGKGGDWDLEKHTGIIETKNIDVENYDYSLANDITSINSSIVNLSSSATNFRAQVPGDSTNNNGVQDSSSDRFIIVQERADVKSGTGTLNFDVSGAKSSHTPSTSEPVHVYLLFSNDETNGNSRRTGSRVGQVTFDYEILGVFALPQNTIAMSGVSMASGTYPTMSSDKIGKRELEYNNDNAPGQEGNGDWFEISNSNKTIRIGTKNGEKGDFIRIITRAPVENTQPVARDDKGYINEDATLTVSNGANANDSTPDTSGEHTGDVIDTSSTSHYDTDADGDTLIVTEIRTGSSEGSGTAGTVGSSLTGSYGQLTINQNGSYTYIANQDLADALDPGDTVTDSFNYTVDDQSGAANATDKAVLEITIAGVNDPITAVNDTDVVNEDATINRSTSDTQELDHDDTDLDADDASGSFTITAIRTGRESASGTSGTIGQALTGTYGVLTVAADGSYSYAATTSGADGLAHGATAIDYFTYTVRDHSGGDTDTAELAITVTGVGPVASNDTGAVDENATLSKNSGAGVIANDTGGDTESLAVTAIRTGTESGSGTNGTVGQALTGTYGVLTLNADGSYSYVANTAAAEALDAGDEVTDVFTYQVSDDDDTSHDSGQITITITGVDDDPVGVNDTGAVNEDATLDVDQVSSGVLSNDTDADADSSLTVSAISGGTVGQAKNGTYGALTLASNGTYTYVANQSGADGLAAGDTATDTFTYTVSDGAGTTDTATLTITVTGIGPQAVNDTGGVNEDATLTVNEASGVISNDDDNSSFDSESLAITGIRTGTESGSGSAGTVGAALTGTYGQLTIAADGSYEYVANQAAADALDPGDTVTDTFTYTVKDDDNKNADTGELVITVTGINDDITAVNDTDALKSGATITRSTSDTQELDHDDTDPDADDVSGSFTITAIRTGASEGAGTTKTIGQAFTTTYGTMTVNADGSYTYAADQSGSTSLGNGVTAEDSFNYTVQDHNSGDTDIATLVITITGSNNGNPVASNDTGVIIEDGTLTVADGGSAVTGTDSNNNNESGDTTGDVLVGDTDPDGDTLTVTAISGGTVGNAVTGTFGTLTIHSNGRYTYAADQAAADALDPGDTGTDTFTYTVGDGNDGYDTATLNFTIIGADDDPVGVNDTGYINEDATLSVSDGGSAVTGSDSNNNNESGDTTGDVLANDTDADGDSSLVVSAISGGTLGQGVAGTYGTLTLNANGSYSYVANQSGADGLAANATATDVFTYTVSDGAGTTDTATLTITVKGVGPVASNDTGSVTEDATLSVSAGSGVTSNDTGGDTESLAVTAIRTGAESGSGSSGTVGQSLTGTYGTLTINSDGSYTYVADQTAADALDPGDSATDTFTYTVADDDDKNTDTGEIVITVNGANDDIVAVNDTDAVNEDATISRSTSDTQELDHDDTDADGDDVPGSFTITAIRTGSESGSGNSGTIGQALTGTYGTLTVNADGSYTYVADQNAADSIVTGQTATDTFTYTVRDHNSGSTDTAELVFTVTGINDENPVAVDDTDTVPKGETITRAADTTFALNADDTDADGESLTISAIRVGQTEGGGDSGTLGSGLVGTYGTLTLNADGSYSYVADQAAADALKRGESAIEYFNYTVTDGTNEDIGVIAITVTGKSDPPVPEDDTLEIDAGATGVKDASKGVLKNDTDPDGDSLTVNTIRTGEEAGTGTSGTIGSPLTGTYGDLTINSDGSYEYKANNAKSLNPGVTKTEYFTYTATDGETPVEAQIAITVTGINDPPEVVAPVNLPTYVTGQKIFLRHRQIFDDPDSGIYDIAEYKIIDPDTDAETSLPDGLQLRDKKLNGSIDTPGIYTITIRAIDGAGLYTDHTFTIKVIPNVITLPPEPNEPEPQGTLEPTKPIKVKPGKMQEYVNEVNIVDDDGFTLDTISIADTASLYKPLKFNGGLRLMDAVASEVSGDDNTDLAVGVKLNDDNQKNVELYSGQLSNGKSLPEWIRVNPETGETTAEMPDGIDQVEVQLVALDKDGNTRDINIVLDKAKIKNDQDFTRGTVGQTRVVVDNDANVNLIRENNNSSNQTVNNNLNAQSDFEGTMKLSSLQMDAGQYTVDVIDDNQSNVKMYKAELKGGGELPDWITIDPQTGKIAADPSKGRTGSAAPSFLTDSLQVLELKIIAEDEDGKERVIEVEIDLNEITGAETDDENSALDDEISFIPLDEQLKLHAKRADSYGEKIISLVS